MHGSRTFLVVAGVLVASQIGAVPHASPRTQPLTAHAEHGSACRPRILDYGSLGGQFTRILAGNRAGQFVGYSETPQGAGKAVRWRGRTPVDIGAISPAIALDINDAGVIVGTQKDGGDQRAFIWRNGHLTELPTLGGSTSLRRINAHGDIAGSAVGRGGTQRAVVWRHGKIHPLALPSGYLGAYAQGINDAGDVVGAAYSAMTQRPWLWKANGTHHALGAADHPGQANVIDNARRVYGGCERVGFEATLWHNSHERGLGFLAGGDFSVALGTNGRGAVVGVANYREDPTEHIFLTHGSPGELPRTLLPLSGDYRDRTNAHFISATFPVKVAGSSDPTADREGRATVWTCAWRQAFVPTTPTHVLPSETNAETPKLLLRLQSPDLRSRY